MQNFSQTAAFIWSIADLLRGDFKQSQYGRVILPFALLRRLECVLEPSKAAVLAQYTKVKDMPSITEESLEKMVLRATDANFFNSSPMDLSKLGEAGIKDNLRTTSRASRGMRGRFLSSSSLRSLSVSWPMPTCCIRWCRRYPTPI
ncbi:MAG: type I restriction-modification system subunit M N-terminal domain-containing protein [Motiliproteus sp.]